jgi:hypothetical protein
MTRDGVTLLCCGKELRVSRAGEAIRLQVNSHGTAYDETVDTLLVAVGRTPNVAGLGLDAVNVRFDAKGVQVNDRLRTTNPRIFAAGDICSPHQFTHAADFMARIVIQNALFLGRARASALTIPWCTYTTPELAHVGLSALTAEQQKIAIETFTPGKLVFVDALKAPPGRGRPWSGAKTFPVQAATGECKTGVQENLAKHVRPTMIPNKAIEDVASRERKTPGATGTQKMSAHGVRPRMTGGCAKTT